MGRSKRSRNKWHQPTGWMNGTLTPSPSLSSSVEPPSTTLSTLAPIWSDSFPQSSLPRYDGVPETWSFLIEVLSHARPYGDVFTDAFGRDYILEPLWKQKLKPHVDVNKNVWLFLGISRTIFSCHYDSTHWKPGYQALKIGVDDGVIWKDDGHPLGADDGAGIFVLHRMIQMGIPGTYIFHNGEERGCIGSRAIADRHGTTLLARGYDRAIAFDRRGTTSIITKMSPGRTCSDKFARALALELGMKHEPDPTGSMTDTGQYIKYIPECTNVSVGYEHEHGPRETLDVIYLMELIEALSKVQFEELPVVRDPKIHEPKFQYQGTGVGYYPGAGGSRPYSGQYSGGRHVSAQYDGYEYDYPFGGYSVERPVTSTPPVRVPAAQPPADVKHERIDRSIEALLTMLEDLYGMKALPDPKEDAAGFVEFALDAVFTGKLLSIDERTLVENALYTYCEDDPEGVKYDLIIALGFDPTEKKGGIT